MDPEIAAALDALRAALANAKGRHLLYLQLLYDDGKTDTVSVPRPPAGDSGQCLPVEGGTCPPARQRGQVEEAILDVLRAANMPLKGRTIAGRADRNYTSYFREALSLLVADGTLVRVEGNGYWLAERGAAPAL